ncbi:MAG: DUF1080 domain-containing protein [Phycisphaeraceae bacterium]|nr:MAG: DUF1080 domain-containing protein [Phycisphaeraceae bacterium]
MSTFSIGVAAAAGMTALAGGVLAQSDAAHGPSGLTPAERAAGWKDYTGEDATTKWRGYKQAAFPSKGWTFENGTLSIGRGSGGGNIVTVEQFTDVEMDFWFKMGEKANSGIMFRVAETGGEPYATGPEFQLLDDAGFGSAATSKQSCGALYDLYAPAEHKSLKPAGEWNQGRIRLRSGVLTHWINGGRIVEARLFNDDGTPSQEWAGKIAASKFKDWKGFGVLPTGHLAVQDHGDTELALHGVKIRDLAKPMPGEKVLFNGKDTAGWTAFAGDAGGLGEGAMKAIAQVRDGVLVIKGQPIGYLRTTEKYTNFVLRLQWRFDASKGAGNSGVLVRMVGEDKVWPKSVEAQLQSGSAGDFWNIDNVVMTTDPERTRGRNTKKVATPYPTERPIGEWNEYEIIVDGGTVILNVNGEELNRATGVAVVPGYICLQSEGAEIHFRNIRLVPLD